MDNLTLAELNGLSRSEAKAKLLLCCGADAWAEKMIQSRPFKNREELYSKAESIWMECPQSVWKEAFGHHPKIGEIESLREKFVATRGFAEREQSGIKGASESLIKNLASANASYEQRFGYIFIVCASGKTAAEMLALLQARLGNSPEVELKIAAIEQAKITRIRLEKMINEKT